MTICRLSELMYINSKSKSCLERKHDKTKLKLINVKIKLSHNFNMFFVVCHYYSNIYSAYKLH